jgi:hypothetical protein
MRQTNKAFAYSDKRNINDIHVARAGAATALALVAALPGDPFCNEP